MAHFLPPEHVRQVNKLEWPKRTSKSLTEGYFVGKRNFYNSDVKRSLV